MEIVIYSGPRAEKKKKAEFTNWMIFRDSRAGQTQITDIEEWSKGILDSVQEATEDLEVDENQEKVNSHMAGLWRRKRQLEEKLKKKKRNRNIGNK